MSSRNFYLCSFGKRLGPAEWESASEDGTVVAIKGSIRRLAPAFPIASNSGFKIQVSLPADSKVA